MSDDFYIGWEDRAPSALAKHVRRTVIGLGIVLVVVVGLVAARQGRFEEGRFEFGVKREFTGVIYETPVPMLHVGASGGSSATNYLLAGFGKFGLPPFARGHHGRSVSFRGTLIEFGANRMIELNDPQSFTAVTAPMAAATGPVATNLGAATFVGELVDTKCYFGVMRPATGKVHRACAIRCLSGGVPPGLLVRTADGAQVVVALSGPGGLPLRYDVEWAGLLVRAAGRLERSGETLILRVDSFQLATGNRL